jgi:ribokinase
MKKLDIVSLGDLNWDEIVRVARLPGPDEEVEAEELLEAPGGDAANFAVAYSRLGGTVAMIGAVGDDLAGRKLRQHVEEAGVDIKRIRVVSTSTGRVHSLVEPTGMRRLVTYRGANNSWRLVQGDVVYLRHSDWIYIADPVPSIIDALAEQFRTGKLDRPLALDPGSVGASRGRSRFAALLPYVKCLFLNEKEALVLSGQSTAEDAIRDLCLDVPLVAIKRGENGCLVASAQEIVAVPAFPIQAIDTTGCGDAFNAAFLFHLQHGNSLQSAGGWGNAAGALVAQQMGAGSSMPTMEETATFLKQQGGAA